MTLARGGNSFIALVLVLRMKRRFGNESSWRDIDSDRRPWRRHALHDQSPRRVARPFLVTVYAAMRRKPSSNMSSLASA